MGTTLSARADTSELMDFCARGTVPCHMNDVFFLAIWYYVPTVSSNCEEIVVYTQNPTNA